MSFRDYLLVLLAIALVVVFGYGAIVYGEDYRKGLDLPVEPGPLEPPPPPSQPPPAVTAVINAPHAPPAAPLPPTPAAPLPPVEPPPSFYGKDLNLESGSLVYVIDISGSMANTDGQATTRLTQAKDALTKSLRLLPRSVKFDVMSYDCYTYACFWALVPADAGNVAQAVAWVDQLQPGGATGTGPAVVMSFITHRTNKLVVLLTDGAPNCGAGSGDDQDPTCLAAHLSQVQGANSQHVVVDVFGIRAYGQFKQFCVSLASETGGTYTDVR